jgi:hypothetical protein
MYVTTVKKCTETYGTYEHDVDAGTLFAAFLSALQPPQFRRQRQQLHPLALTVCIVLVTVYDIINTRVRQHDEKPGIY